LLSINAAGSVADLAQIILGSFSLNQWFGAGKEESSLIHKYP
jgi:hypothetical protein